MHPVLRVVFAASLLSLAGCQAERDLGLECRMTKPTEAGPEDILASSVEDPNLDYMALGSAECDDLVCVRTAGSENPENVDGKARGYCTAPCIDARDCEPDFEGRTGTMGCERLLPDQEFLETLKQSDPELYEKTFGSGVSAKYCVKPRVRQ
jgi:hypothetical protein